MGRQGGLSICKHAKRLLVQAGVGDRQEERGAGHRLRAGPFLCSLSRVLQIFRVAGARL